jgi:hypothetical protein
MNIKIVINMIETIEAFKVPKSKPPFDKGLVRKSPNVAPKGLVKTKATQNNIMWFMVVN